MQKLKCPNCDHEFLPKQEEYQHAYTSEELKECTCICSTNEEFWSSYDKCKVHGKKQEECKCNEGHGGSYLKSLPRVDCPIHNLKKSKECLCAKDILNALCPIHGNPKETPMKGTQPKEYFEEKREFSCEHYYPFLSGAPKNRIIPASWWNYCAICGINRPDAIERKVELPFLTQQPDIIGNLTEIVKGMNGYLNYLRSKEGGR